MDLQLLLLCLSIGSGYPLDHQRYPSVLIGMFYSLPPSGSLTLPPMPSDSTPASNKRRRHSPSPSSCYCPYHPNDPRARYLSQAQRHPSPARSYPHIHIGEIPTHPPSGSIIPTLNSLGQTRLARRHRLDLASIINTRLLFHVGRCA